jgi:ATP-dependent RNA helicase RhlE
MSRAIVFTRTKHGADKVVHHLHARGIRAEAIHGNKSQNARQRALANFKASKIPVLVATDIASRGIDIDDVSHVVNYDLTHEPETYVHRIGRTARAGASGAAVSFCDKEERSNLRAIESLIRRAIPVRNDHPTYTDAPPAHAQRPHVPQQDQTRRSQRPTTPPAMGRRTALQQPANRHQQPRPQHAQAQRGNVNSHRGRPSSRRPARHR